MTDRKRILFVGEHPVSMSGNGNMMAAILSQLDTERFSPTCFVAGFPPDTMTAFKQSPVPIISAIDGKKYHDFWGKEHLLDVVKRVQLDVLCMVGVDIWRYADIFGYLKQMRDEKHFKWVSIFPFDLHETRKDWNAWIKDVDFPCVYSEYGYEMLKNDIPNLRYFRPPLFGHDFFTPMDADERRAVRKRLFGKEIDDDAKIFGFVGINSFRKCPNTVLEAFKILKGSYDGNAYLYMHTENTDGVYNISQMAEDLGYVTGDLAMKRQGEKYPIDMMVKIYNSLDCLVNCSMQEGLGWPPLEAMLCGVPVILSDSTAHRDFIAMGAGLKVPCASDAMVPMITRHGESWIRSKQCRATDVAAAMESIASDLEFAGEIGLKGHEVALSWLDGVSNINTLLEDVMTERVIELATNHKPKKDMVLFCQHSSAGDVLMTTRCFDGIKNRYGLPLAYMTSPQYMDIIEGNPHIVEVLSWDPEVASEFKHVLNPHNDIILPGHWGRNCNSILSDFYWKILRVEPGPFHIELLEPEQDIADKVRSASGRGDGICILHTCGGDKAFRSYQYMPDVAGWLGNGPRFFTVQLGGEDDPDAGAELDLRGRLSFRESAWVMDKAVLAVTIDSFISHLAGAFGVSQVCLFGSGNAVVTRPNQTKGMLICLSPDYVTDCKGLGPCSGSVKDCPVSCTGRHSPMDIIEAISEIKLAGMVKRNVEHETSVCIFKHAE